MYEKNKNIYIYIRYIDIISHIDRSHGFTTYPAPKCLGIKLPIFYAGPLFAAKQEGFGEARQGLGTHRWTTKMFDGQDLQLHSAKADHPALVEGFSNTDRCIRRPCIGILWMCSWCCHPDAADLDLLASHQEGCCTIGLCLCAPFHELSNAPDH